MTALLGRFAPWFMGGAATLILLLGGMWWLEASRAEAAQLRVAALRGELATARAAIADREAVMAALERQEAAMRAAAARLAPIRRVVNAAPVTRACLDSPAIARGVERLRAARAATAGPGAGPDPSDVPGRASGT